MIKSVNTILCQVVDMERAVSFYRDTLGLPIGVHSPYWSDFLVGGVNIGLHPPFASGEPIRGGSGWILGLETDDLSSLRNELARAGYPYSSEYHNVPGGVVLDFADPDGHPIQAIQLGVSAKELNDR